MTRSEARYQPAALIADEAVLFLNTKDLISTYKHDISHLE